MFGGINYIPVFELACYVLIVECVCGGDYARVYRCITRVYKTERACVSYIARVWGHALFTIVTPLSLCLKEIAFSLRISRESDSFVEEFGRQSKSHGY